MENPNPKINKSNKSYLYHAPKKKEKKNASQLENEILTPMNASKPKLMIKIQKL